MSLPCTHIHPHMCMRTHRLWTHISVREVAENLGQHGLPVHGRMGNYQTLRRPTFLKFLCERGWGSSCFLCSFAFKCSVLLFWIAVFYQEPVEINVLGLCCWILVFFSVFLFPLMCSLSFEEGRETGNLIIIVTMIFSNIFLTLLH